MDKSIRKIDVDAYDEDQYVEDENDQVGNVDAEVNARATEVRGFLNKGNAAEAVRKALDNPPLGKKVSDSAKEKNTQTVMDALQAAKSNEIPAIVKSLSSPQQDTLMKYIYRGFEFPNKFNSAVLLTWHAAVVEAGGNGTIIRVLTDNKTV